MYVCMYVYIYIYIYILLILFIFITIIAGIAGVNVLFLILHF